MFTGIVLEIGTIEEIKRIAGGISAKISCSKAMEDILLGESISINGVCLTVTKFNSSSFWADAVGETLKKSTLANINVGQKVNLEKAVKLSDRLGGHLVQGHVNGIGRITSIQKLGENYSLEIEIPESQKKYVINEGSISIDGISLTVAKVEGTKIRISVIPHTWQQTNLKGKKAGDEVNIEVDLIAKYVENMLVNKTENKNNISEEWLKNLGY